MVQGLDDDFDRVIIGTGHSKGLRVALLNARSRHSTKWLSIDTTLD